VTENIETFQIKYGKKDNAPSKGSFSPVGDGGEKADLDGQILKGGEE
jgi:hypothetical protein